MKRGQHRRMGRRYPNVTERTNDKKNDNLNKHNGHKCANVVSADQCVLENRFFADFQECWDRSYPVFIYQMTRCMLMYVCVFIDKNLP